MRLKTMRMLLAMLLTTTAGSIAFADAHEGAAQKTAGEALEEQVETTAEDVGSTMESHTDRAEKDAKEAVRGKSDAAKQKVRGKSEAAKENARSKKEAGRAKAESAKEAARNKQQAKKRDAHKAHEGMKGAAASKRNEAGKKADDMKAASEAARRKAEARGEVQGSENPLVSEDE